MVKLGPIPHFRTFLNSLQEKEDSSVQHCILGSQKWSPAALREARFHEFLPSLKDTSSRKSKHLAVARGQGLVAITSTRFLRIRVKRKEQLQIGSLTGQKSTAFTAAAWIISYGIYRPSTCFIRTNHKNKVVTLQRRLIARNG